MIGNVFQIKNILIPIMYSDKYALSISGRLYKAVLISFILLFTSSAAYSQYQQNISGTVIDEERLSLEGVSIQLINNNDSVIKAVQSDSIGRFTIKNISPGKYVLFFHMVGRTPQNVKITVGKKNISELEVILPFDYEATLPEVNVTAKMKQVVVAKLKPEIEIKELREQTKLRGNNEDFHSGKKSHTLKHRYYEGDKYAGKWQWKSIKEDTVFTVFIKNEQIEITPTTYSASGTHEVIRDRYFRDLLIGWYELKVNDSILFSNINEKPRITSFAKFDDTQKQCLIGVFRQHDLKRTIHMTLRKNPLAGVDRGFLIFTLLGENGDQAFWNLWVMVKNTYEYALIQKPLPGDFVLPTKVIMKRVTDE